MSADKIYLGDGAYAEVEHDQQAIVLTTENGIETTNRVVLEAEVLKSFLDFLQAHGIITWRLHDGT